MDLPERSEDVDAVDGFFVGVGHGFDVDLPEREKLAIGIDVHFEDSEVGEHYEQCQQQKQYWRTKNKQNDSGQEVEQVAKDALYVVVSQKELLDVLKSQKNVPC